MSTHTKGPWYISLREGDHYIWSLENDTNPVCKVFSVYENSPEANAHLIAAAPELFEVLKEVQSLVNGARWHDANERTNTWLKVDKVLRKAEGRSK